MMSKDEFLAEAQIMKTLCHENLVKLHALCTQTEPIYIITELMSKGNLLGFLKDEGRSLGVAELIGMSSKVAAGMAYLEKMNYIHRDLAARNVLVGKDNSVKIADFGLARAISDNVYMARAGLRLPIRVRNALCSRLSLC